jgi:hypothetical protein
MKKKKSTNNISKERLRGKRSEKVSEIVRGI